MVKQHIVRGLMSAPLDNVIKHFVCNTNFELTGLIYLFFYSFYVLLDFLQKGKKVNQLGKKVSIELTVE